MMRKDSQKYFFEKYSTAITSEKRNVCFANALSPIMSIKTSKMEKKYVEERITLNKFIYFMFE